jgi:hypothetical protein
MTIAIDVLDLDAAYARGCEKLNKPRGDEGLAHVGDVSGLCDREAWARRKSGKPLPVNDVETLTAFWLGHAAEVGMLDRIEAGLPEGYRMERNVLVALWLDKTGKLQGARKDTTTGVPGVVWGHLDAAIYDAEGNLHVVPDTKSTVWWSKNEAGRQVWYPKGPPKIGHELQVSTYAIALGAKKAALYELDLAGKGRRTSWVDPEAHRAEVTQRVAEVLERTDPSKPEPDVAPNRWTSTGEGSWACGTAFERVNKQSGEIETIIKRGYCRYTACPNHVSNVEVEF